MPNILVLNLGSTSFKYEVFDIKDLTSLQKGNFKMETDELPDIQGRQDTIDKIFRKVLREIGEIENIKYVAHRYVHGGNKYLKVKEIDQQEIVELEKINDLAPLHNPYNLAGIKSSNKYIPKISDYAVFDTAFFKNLPLRSKIYPIPYEYFEQGIHRFGFHGISHKFAYEQACKKLKLDFENCKIITVHLGGGCSVTAIEKGQPLETSMGFTPLEGLMMQTRSGDIDPGIIFELIKKEGDVQKVEDILNKESGIKGICGCENFLELLDKVKQKDEKSNLAFEMFVGRIKKYIAGYLAVLNGEVEAIVFTGKIGANDKITRDKIIKDNKLFENIKVLTVKPHEELAIAREVLTSL